MTDYSKLPKELTDLRQWVAWGKENNLICTVS